MKQIETEKNINFNDCLKHENFTKRHIGPNKNDIQEMLNYIGCNSLEELINQTVPNNIRFKKSSNESFNSMGGAISEKTALEYIQYISDKNEVYTNYIGCGFHPTFVPPVILRNITENPGWYTSYTPYQSEISQGRLKSLLNFQTLVSELSGLPYANASLLDEATSAAEAMYLSFAHHNQKRKSFYLDKNTYPFIKELMYSRAHYIGIKIIEGDIINDSSIHNNKEICGVYIQNPSDTGKFINHSNLVHKLKQSQIITIMGADPLASVIFKSAGEMGFDVCVGSMQRFGVPMMNGGPHAGFMAVKEELKRKMPGRVVGISKDSTGKKAYRLSLQTREQHIKRERATSNICTAQALLANMSAFYAIFYGKEGLKRIANRVYIFSYILSKTLNSIGYKTVNNCNKIFDTVVIELNDKIELNSVINTFYKNKINLRRYKNNNYIGISFNDTTTYEDLEEIVSIFSIMKNISKDIKNIINIDLLIDKTTSFNNLINKDLLKSQNESNKFLEHDIFNKYTSESQIMRYINYLQEKDYSLIHGMIPLGSCTLKLNSAAEMIPITWPKFANIHPFSPSYQMKGYKIIIDELISYLKIITQMDAVSVQPNSGANGEFAGMLAIRRYQDSIGQGNRDIVLIPSSAHGTNPASAAICGLKNVIVLSDKNGNIDYEDLKLKVEKHKNKLCAIMITYPSTHGVFEEKIQDITNLIHSNGGQVYIDGANMNAQMGITAPGLFGGDVCHLNLHKTFSIPHGGGGPGIGPICVKKHLEEFLPSHNELDDTKKSWSVTSAPFGSAGILPISYMYIKMQGSELLNSSRYAILNANYVLNKLKDHYNILYTGSNNRCAHEFIIDIRPLKATCGITEEDVSKRLIDYSFHPPTMSFPVNGSIMFEPTESEDKEELDRYIEAMISIRNEIKEIEEGKVDKLNNVLKNAPHSLNMLLSDNWNKPYSREKAAYPVKSLKRKKFFPSVSRIDNIYGDLNLICTCPPIEEYEYSF